MTKETEQKILDAALNLFAREGYKGATTRAIADEAGFNELTLFRKFKNKENLFDEVMIQNNQKLADSFMLIFSDIDQKFDNSRDFLEVYIKRMAKFYMDNFEGFNLLVNEDYTKLDLDMGEFVNFIGKFLERNMESEKIDHTTLGIIINTFMYAVNLERYHGRTSIGEETIEKFLNNLLLCVK